MVVGRLFLYLCMTGLCGVLSVGCLGKKDNTTTAVEEQAPPPAAYPDTPNYADSTSGGAAQTPSAPPSSAPSAPAPAAPSAPAFQLRDGEQLVEHKIAPGENLSSIAQKYNTSYRRIQAANGMSNTKIYAGKTIQVPTSAPPSNLAMNSSAAAPAPAASSPYGSTGGRYGSVTSTAPSTSAPTGSYPGTVAPPPVSSGAGAYPSTTAPPSPPVSSSPYPGTTSAPATNPGATSYRPSTAPSAPTAPVTPPSPPAFPTPNFGGGNVQFSQ